MKNRLLILFAFSVVLILNACSDDDPVLPVATATPSEQTITSGDATSISLTSTVTGTTFSWTVVQTDVSGATDGTGSSIAQTLTATGLASGIATYTVVPKGNGVTGSAISVVVTVNPALTTYDANAKPIFVASCSPCHLDGGGNPNKWDDYASAKGSINSILDRVQRETDAAGFMPKGGNKMSDEDIAILQKWLDDGLLEN